MNLDYDFLEQIESASLFKLTQEEKVKIKSELENMILKFKVLEEFDTDGIEPFDFNADFVNNFRDDLVKQSDDKDLLRQGTFLDKQDYFKVPKTLN